MAYLSPAPTVTQDVTGNQQNTLTDNTALNLIIHNTASNARAAFGFRWHIPSTFSSVVSGLRMTLTQSASATAYVMPTATYVYVYKIGSEPAFSTTDSRTPFLLIKNSGANYSSSPVGIAGTSFPINTPVELNLDSLAADVNAAIAGNGSHASTGTELGIIVAGSDTTITGIAPTTFTFNSSTHVSANKPALSLEYIEGATDRFLDGSVGGTSEVTGTPRWQEMPVFNLTGVGATVNASLTGGEGFDTSMAVHSGSVSAPGTGAVHRWVSVSDVPKSYSNFAVRVDNDLSSVAYLQTDSFGTSLGLGHSGRIYVKIAPPTGAETTTVIHAINADSTGVWTFNIGAIINTDTSQAAYRRPSISTGGGSASGNGTVAQQVISSQWWRIEWRQTGVEPTDSLIFDFYDLVGLESADPEPSTPKFSISALLGSPPSGTNVIDRFRIGQANGGIHKQLEYQNVQINNSPTLPVGPWIAAVTHSLDGTLAGTSDLDGEPFVERVLDGEVAGLAVFSENPQEPVLDGVVNLAAFVSGLGTVTISGTQLEHVLDTALSGVGSLVGDIEAVLSFLDINYDLAGPEAGSAPQRCTLAASDNTSPGSNRKLDVHLPNTPAPESGYPVLVWVHGGFFSQGDKSNVTNPDTASTTNDNGAAKSMYDKFLAAGFAVISLNYRLSLTATKSPDLLQPTDHFDDICLALSFLKANEDLYGIDMNNFFMSGHSAGGYLAAMSAFVSTMPDTTVTDWYQQFTPAGYTTYDVDFRARYTEAMAGYPLDLLRPRGVLMWEAPVDFRYAVTQAYNVANASAGPIVAQSSANTLDGHVRRFVRAGLGATESTHLPEAQTNHLDLANQASPHDSKYVSSHSPPMFYVACGSTFNFVTQLGSFLPTVGSGGVSTGGHGYFLKKRAEASGLSYTEYFASGTDSHDNINSFRTTEAVTWANRVLRLVFNDRVVGTATAIGVLKTYKERIASGIVSGTSVASGILSIDRMLDADVSGTSELGGGLVLDRVLDDEVAGSSELVGSISSLGVTVVSDLVVSGEASLDGSPYVERVLVDLVEGVGTVEGVPYTGNVHTLDTDLSGSGTLAGELFREIHLSSLMSGDSEVDGPGLDTWLLLDVSADFEGTGTLEIEDPEISHVWYLDDAVEGTGDFEVETNSFSTLWIPEAVVSGQGFVSGDLDVRPVYVFVPNATVSGLGTAGGLLVREIVMDSTVAGSAHLPGQVLREYLAWWQVDEDGNPVGAELVGIVDENGDWHPSSDIMVEYVLQVPEESS